MDGWRRHWRQCAVQFEREMKWTMLRKQFISDYKKEKEREREREKVKWSHWLLSFFLSFVFLNWSGVKLRTRKNNTNGPAWQLIPLKVSSRQARKNDNTATWSSDVINSIGIWRTNKQQQQEEEEEEEEDNRRRHCAHKKVKMNAECENKPPGKRQPWCRLVGLAVSLMAKPLKKKETLIQATIWR